MRREGEGLDLGGYRVGLRRPHLLSDCDDYKPLLAVPRCPCTHDVLCTVV